MPEEWRPIPGIVGYEVSAAGRVRSLTRMIYNRHGVGHLRKGRLLVLSVGSTGYPKVNFGSQGQWDVHRLVALTFIGPPPAGMQVCHFNGVRSDNRVENLRYGTAWDNTQDAIRHGTSPGAATHCPAGHAYDELNTYPVPTGGRGCRACGRARARASRRRLRERVG